jgi:hypothetical protein
MLRKITCTDCGATINEAANLPGRKQPCPQCGSTSRLFAIEAHDTVALNAHMQGRSKHRQPGRKKLTREERFGHDFFRKNQRWSILRRTVDYENDWYFEMIRDLETGALIRFCSEPLSQHRGHGSAKRRNRPA